MSEPQQADSSKRPGTRHWLMAALLVAVVALSSFSTVDRYAEQEYEALFERALITFALARTLNGAISAVQGTELALQPAGVGVTLTPGEVLDPVNDLVERFSWIMLGATLSLGVQQILLDIGQWWGMKALVALLGLLWLWFTWRRRAFEERGAADLDRYLLRALLVVLFLRFAVPMAMIANEAVYSVFLEDRYQQSTQVIETAGGEIQRATEKANAEEGGAKAEGAQEESGFFDSIGLAFDSTRETLDFNRRLAYIGERASEVIENLLQLSVVFIFQTGILPIAFLWLFLRAFKWLLRSNN